MPKLECVSSVEHSVTLYETQFVVFAEHNLIVLLGPFNVSRIEFVKLVDHENRNVFNKTLQHVGGFSLNKVDHFDAGQIDAGSCQCLATNVEHLCRTCLRYSQTIRLDCRGRHSIDVFLDIFRTSYSCISSIPQPLRQSTK